MKKTILLMTVLTSMTAFGGGSHYHPKQLAKCPKTGCTETEIKAAVPAAIEHLAKWKKIDLAWKEATIKSVTTKEFKKGPEFVVLLEDSKASNYYVFFTTDGFVSGANASGN